MISGFGVIKGQRFPFRCASSEPLVFCFLTKPCSYRSALLFHCKPEILVFLICSSGELNAMSLPLLYNVGVFSSDACLTVPPDLSNVLLYNTATKGP